MMEEVKRLLALDEEIDEAEGKLAALKKDRAAVAERVQETFVEEGVQNLSTGGKCVYLARSLWTNVIPEKKEEARGVLQALGLGAFVKESINGQQLSAWCREKAEGEEPIPEELKQVVRFFEKFEIKVRKA